MTRIILIIYSGLLNEGRYPKAPHEALPVPADNRLFRPAGGANCPRRQSRCPDRPLANPQLSRFDQPLPYLGPLQGWGEGRL